MSISPPSLPYTLPSFSFNFHSLSITPLQMSMCYVWHYLLSSKQGYTKKGRCTNISYKIDRYTCCPKAIFRISLSIRYMILWFSCAFAMEYIKLNIFFDSFTGLFLSFPWMISPASFYIILNIYWSAIKTHTISVMSTVLVYHYNYSLIYNSLKWNTIVIMLEIIFYA